MSRGRSTSQSIVLSPGDSLLKQLKSGEIKVSSKMEGAQAKLVVLSSATDSYFVSLPRMPLEPEELKNYKLLRNYLANPQFSHPNLIQFIRFLKEDDLLNGLIEEKIPDAVEWSKKWAGPFQSFKENVPYDISSLSAQALRECQTQFRDLDCARKAPGTTLADLFINVEQYNLIKSHAVPFFLKIVGAVIFLNALGFIHNDLSTYNILIDPKTLQVTVIDIGATRKYMSLTHEWVEFSSSNGDASPLLAPPEVLKCLKPTELKLKADRLDSFGLGVVFYQLLTGKSDVNIFNMEEKLFKGNLKAELSKVYLDLDSDEIKMNQQISKSMERDGITDETIQKLLFSLLHIDNNKRLSVFEILASPLFSGSKKIVETELELALKAAIFSGNKFAQNKLIKNSTNDFKTTINLYELDKALIIKSEIRQIERLLKEEVIPYLQGFQRIIATPINAFNTFAISPELIMGVGRLCTKLVEFVEVVSWEKDNAWVENVKKLLEFYINKKHKYDEIRPKIEYFYDKIKEIRSSGLSDSYVLRS
ncbi:MAG: protein kinase [Proteobacteria bacterium]|nr:protein kinase [Pseudomonadota bacterium]